MITLETWLKEFNKLTVEYINSINWNTVIFNDGDIEQIGDDLQKEAFQNLNENIDDFVSDWEDYSDTCDARNEFQRELSERWESTTKVRETFE